MANCCGTSGIKHFEMYCYWKGINLVTVTPRHVRPRKHPVVDYFPIMACNVSTDRAKRTSLPVGPAVTAEHL